uniref:Uncharacterized protein n=1 Tax=Latilactobacillus sakei TaxID=1599 RepID=A0A8F1IGJ8_LATSK|nr:hypothetical protein CLHJBBGJ_00006 [Latilactobacillus sakei]
MVKGFKINYSKTTEKEVYMTVDKPDEERKRDFLIAFFKRNLIAFSILKNGDFKVYWHNWITLADLLEEQWEG